MPIRDSSICNSGYTAQVTNEANDLGVGVAITPVVIAGISGGLLGYHNPAAAYYNAFAEGAKILAEDTGRVWSVGTNSANLRTLVLLSQGTGNILSPLTGLLFVDAAAVAGGNGSIAQPYNTLQAALNAALANTEIRLTAGTYVEDVVMPNKDYISITASGPGETILRNATNTSTFSWVRSGVVPAINQFLMSGLTVENTSNVATDGCFNFDATLESPSIAGQSNAFLTVGCFFTRVNARRKSTAAGRTAFIRRVGNMQWNDCDWRADVGVAGSVVTQNLGRGTAFNSFFSNTDQEYLRSNPAPFDGRNAFTLGPGSAVAVTNNGSPNLQGGVILRGHPIFIAAQDTAIAGSNGGTLVNAIEGIGLTTTNGSGGVGPAAAPIIQIASTIGNPSVTGAGKVKLPLPAFAAGFAVPSVDFSRAQFLLFPATAGDVTITSASPSFTTQGVSMNQSRLVFLSALGAPVAGAIVVGSATAGINNPVSLDVKGAFFYAQNVFNVASGSFLDRSTWTISMAAFTVAPIVQAISPPYPAGSTYAVSYQSSLPVALGVTAPTTSTVTITAASAVPAGGSITLTRT